MRLEFDWNTKSVKEKSSHTSKHTDFLDFLDDTGLDQIVTEPTRQQNTLDLFITNNETLVQRCKTIPGISDHEAVFVENNLAPRKLAQKPRKIPLYKKAQWDKLKEHMSKFHENLTQEDKASETANSLWERFKASLEEGIEKYIPHRIAGKKDSHPWITFELKKLIRKRNKLYITKQNYPSR